MEEQRKKAEEDRAQKKESPAVTQKKLKTGDIFNFQVETYVEKGEGCEVCGKRVYPMERFSIGEKAYHQQCFKCAHCNRPLTLGM